MKLQSEIHDQFPKMEKRRLGRWEFRFPPAQPPAFEELGLQGVFFTSEDDKQTAQLRVDGFTLNRLKPYPNWDDLFSQAKMLWTLYIGVAQPVAVTRLALRYINHIQLPRETEDLSRYLRVPPQVPAELPQDVGAFLTA